MQMLNRRFIAYCVAIALLLVLPPVASADDPAPSAKLHRDGFPTGHATAEGAAADLMRAYIGRDYRLFNEVRIVRMCEGYNNPPNYYAEFLRHTSFSSGSETFRIDTLSNPVKRISKVFVARSLTPLNEHGEAKNKEEITEWKLNLMLHFLEDRMFVDLVVADSAGKEYLHRAIVDKTTAGTYYAVPSINATRRIDKRLKAYGPSTDEFSIEEKSDKENKPGKQDAK